MKNFTTRREGKRAMRSRHAGAVGLALAIGCLVAAAPPHAEDRYRGHGEQHGQRHDSRPYHHGGYRGGGGGGGYYEDQDYAYGAPPVVYAPQAAPGINLFIPLRIR